jgi:hypothetical protein
MAKDIGIWDDATIKTYSYTLVPHEKEDFFDYVISEQSIKDCKKIRLKPSVKKNPEIFFWYLALTRPEYEIEINQNFYDSSSGYIVSLLGEFFEAFQKLDVISCYRLTECFSSIDFKNFYIFRIEWLIDELLNYATIFREAFIETSPMTFLTQNSYKEWWNQDLGIRKSLSRTEKQCSLDKFSEIDLLKPLAQLYYQIDKGLGQWGARRGLDKLEAASGYFMALAEYWLKAGQPQISLLCIHRSIDCVLLLMGHQDGQVFATSNGLINDDGDLVRFIDNFYKLYNGSKRNFSSSERSLILDLNDCRNYLRETHGFRVVSRSEVCSLFAKSVTFLQNLQPDIKSFSYKEKFKLDFTLPLKLIFEVESDVGSYIDIS